MWLVTAEYQGFDPEFDQKLEALLGERSASGYFFGGETRDLEWAFDSEEKAQAAVFTLRHLLLKPPELTISIEEDED